MFTTKHDFIIRFNTHLLEADKTLFNIFRHRESFSGMCPTFFSFFFYPSDPFYYYFFLISCVDPNCKHCAEKYVSDNFRRGAARVHFSQINNNPLAAPSAYFTCAHFSLERREHQSLSHIYIAPATN
jgi:hypothetical protein